VVMVAPRVVVVVQEQLPVVVVRGPILTFQS